MRTKLLILVSILSISGQCQMQALWRMNGNSNDTVNSYNGTDANVSYVAGIKDNCASFNGSSSVIDYGDVLDASTTAWTYSVWFLCSSSAASIIGIMGKSVETSAAARYMIIFVSSTSLYTGFICRSSTLYTATTTVTDCYDSKWHNIVLTATRGGGGSMKTYLDSKLINTTTLTLDDGAMNCVYPVGIGAYRNSTNTAWKYWLNGRVDEAYMSNTVLTEGNVKNQYAYFKGFF
jgi:hypothetical protein